MSRYSPCRRQGGGRDIASTHSWPRRLMGERSALSPGCVLPSGKDPSTHWIGGWESHRDGLNTEARGKTHASSGDRTPIRTLIPIASKRNSNYSLARHLCNKTAGFSSENPEGVELTVVKYVTRGQVMAVIKSNWSTDLEQSWKPPIWTVRVGTGANPSRCPSVWSRVRLTIWTGYFCCKACNYRGR
jgi:hypothetical protein